METLYKVLGTDGSADNGGNGKWYLPQDDGPGNWMPPIEDINPCKRGYHLCRRKDLVQWLGPIIFVAEARGKSVDCSDKVVFSEARLLRQMTGWTERTARLFACDCAERVVHLCTDQRSCDAIAVARQFANGEASAEELVAAWAAAGNAARDAVWEAARAATRAAAGAAARDAARDAAWFAARAAVGSARGSAWDAEYQWQTERLFWYLSREE